MKRKLLNILFLTSSIFIISACQKIDIKDHSIDNLAIEYYKKGEYKKAIMILEKAANAGDINASYSLGEIYRKGEGIDKDQTKACMYYRKSAEGGNHNAYLISGACSLIEGKEDENFREAFKWLKKASEEINESAQTDVDKKILANSLANLYMSGKGTLQDFSEAAKWARKAAELGDARAQGILAFFLFTGTGVLQNKTEARIWAEKSAEQANHYGQLMMGALSQYNVTSKSDIREAIKWYEKAAKQGNEVAQYQLAVIYENGDGIAKDMEKAKYYYELAAKSSYEFPKEVLQKFMTKQKNHE